MESVPVNYLAVFLGAVASMAVGFLWYSPILFAKAWTRLMGLNPKVLKESQKTMGGMYALSFVAAMITAYVLTHTMFLSRNFYGNSPVLTGVTTAFFVWLGFIMPVQLTDVIFGGRKWELWFINTGYQLASVMAMGIVIGLMS